MKSLDLYADIEDMLDFEQEYDSLQEYYLQLIREIRPKNILDVGCGNGAMLQKLKNENMIAKGIDRSSKMVEKCLQKGLDADLADIKDISESFDAVCAIGDVLNYIDKDSLTSFFRHIQNILTTDGVFLCDINTLYSFTDLTSGTYVKDENERFLTLESEFEQETLLSSITYFHKKNEECFQKQQAYITQYFHTIEEIKEKTSLELLNSHEISMFTDEIEKTLLLFIKK